MGIWLDPDGPTARWVMENGAPGQWLPGTVVPGRVGEDWGLIERRASIANPLSPSNNVNPHYQGPTHNSGFIPGTAILSRWTCSYCGGSRAADLDNCPGCGAGRM